MDLSYTGKMSFIKALSECERQAILVSQLARLSACTLNVVVLNPTYDLYCMSPLFYSIFHVALHCILSTVLSLIYC